MAALVTIPELSVWTRQEIAFTDEFAVEVLAAASDLVRAAARQPTWTRETAPPRARQICAHLAARTYTNPDSVQFQGAIGPLGGDRIVQELAMAMHLTPAESAELGGMAPNGSGTGGLWVQPINSTPVDGSDVYLPDDSGSDWMIPYLAEDDVQALG